MKTWLVRFRLDDDGKEGGYFSRKEVIQMIKQIQTAGLEVSETSVIQIRREKEK